MDGEGVADFQRVASLPDVVRAAAMPDLHAGPGSHRRGNVITNSAYSPGTLSIEMAPPCPRAMMS